MPSLRTPPSPNLPLAPSEWSRHFQDGLLSILRQYFNQLSSVLQSVTAPAGGRFINSPHGSFYDSTRQTAASTTTAYKVSLGETSLSNGVRVRNGTEIDISNPGVYNLQLSLQLANDDNAPQDIDVWFRVNGADVPDSNSRFGLAARKSVGDPYHTLAALNFFFDIRVKSSVEVMWRTSNTSAFLEAYAAGTSPTRPALPSAIVTVAFVSSRTE